MKLFTNTFLLILLTFAAFAGTAPKSDLEVIRQRFVDELMAPEVNDAKIDVLMKSIQTDGTWANIDYKDVSRTGFQHAEHLRNMVEMSRAFKKKGSKFKGNKQLKKAIYSALDFWLGNDFICDNWWHNQIGTPNALAGVLLIMDEDLTKEQVSGILPMVGRAHLEATGARPSGDRIKIAGILAKTLLFQRNETQFNDVVRVIEGEIKFSTGFRGMQHDYSFHHREDRVNNTLSYGLGYADAFAEWAANVSGTKYQFSEKPLQHLTDYYLDGICKMMVFGKYSDPGAKNRDISREDSGRGYGTATPERLLQAGNYRKNELEEIIKIRHGEADATLAHSTFFWQTEHFTFQRPGFFTSVRMYSTRNDNMEMPYNSEGLMNHHRGDGTNYISRTAREYLNIAPVYDWQKIPGATVLQKPELPSEDEIQKNGLTDFVGAVTDGLYGAVAFDFKSPHDLLKAKKAWFFFDEEYICLGAGIKAGSRLPVATTINQCLLRDEVVIMNEGKKSVLKKGEHEINETKWILHDGVGYLFPEPQKVNLSNQAQTGSWFKINQQSDSPKEEISLDVFKLWVDHGARPQAATYAYVVVPSADEQKMETYSNAKFQILANSEKIQAVKHAGLNICQAVFYTSGDIQLSEKIKLGLDSPGVVMLKTDGQAIKAISVADPSRKLGKLHLSISAKIEKKAADFNAVWNPEKGISEITIELPQTVYAGQSVSINL
jgi:chondroitin AC lyase